MIVKFSGGPMHGKYSDAPDDYMREFKIRAPKEQNPKQWLESKDPFEQIEMKRGTYYKSNERLKNGTVIFKWMGWIT